MTLDLMVSDYQEEPQAVGALTVRALTAGPVPLAFTDVTQAAAHLIGDALALAESAGPGEIALSATAEDRLRTAETPPRLARSWRHSAPSVAS